MTFNINSQQGGQITNIVGKQTVRGGQHAAVQPSLPLHDALDVLRTGVATAKLTSTEKRAAKRHVQDIDDELRHPRPDKRTVADRLRKVTEILVAAGALATGGTALVQAIGSLASWVGTLGEGIVGLLHSTGPGTAR